MKHQIKRIALENLKAALSGGRLSESRTPADDGAVDAWMDNRAMTNKSIPFGYYSEEFYSLERIKDELLRKKHQYKDENLGKAAALISRAMDQMLKSGKRNIK